MKQKMIVFLLAAGTVLSACASSAKNGGGESTRVQTSQESNVNETQINSDSSQEEEPEFLPEDLVFPSGLALNYPVMLEFSKMEHISYDRTHNKSKTGWEHILIIIRNGSPGTCGFQFGYEKVVLSKPETYEEEIKSKRDYFVNHNVPSSDEYQTYLYSENEDYHFMIKYHKSEDGDNLWISIRQKRLTAENYCEDYSVTIDSGIGENPALPKEVYDALIMDIKNFFGDFDAPAYEDWTG